MACLEMVFTDFKMAHSLDPNHPGKDQGNFLLMPQWKKIELTEGPGNGGDRSLAHSLRLLRWCRPYFDTKPYDEAMRQWARKLSDQYGMTECGSPPFGLGSESALAPVGPAEQLRVPPTVSHIRNATLRWAR